MSNQFYSYLSKKIIDFFKQNPLIPGSKYNIQFEKREQVKGLYEKLEENTLSRIYEYTDSKGEVKYQSYQLDFNGVSLIVSSTMNDVQPDFLTRLRNMVGMEEGYKQKAILFIHDTTLDSIIGGTESFSKEGMPFHIDSIQKDIKNRLAINSFKEYEKEIIELDLKRKKEGLISNTNSIFEYEEILDVLNKGYISEDQYKDFGLFNDRNLCNFEGKQLKNRIKDNAWYFNEVSEIHNYGSPESQLEKYFDDKGVTQLEKEGWQLVDYEVVKKSIDNKKTTKPLEYIPLSQEWDKEEGSTKVKKRIRNIIVFNESKKEEVELEFSFDDYLKQVGVSVDGEAEAKTSGKKLKVTIKDIEGKSNFYKITYKLDSIKFEFKILMLHCSSKYFESIKSNYSLSMKKKNNNYLLIDTNESFLIFNEYAQKEVTHELFENNDVINLNNDERLKVKINENFIYEDDQDLVRFNLKINNELLPVGVIGRSEKTPPIEGFNVWKLKRENRSDFKLIGENKFRHGTKEYFTRDEFKNNLSLEKQFIEMEGLCFEEYSDGIESVNLKLPTYVETTYKKIINYYKLSNQLPSLTYINDNLRKLYEDFIQSYLDALNDIEEGTYLDEEKDLLKLGTLKRYVEDHELILTPLHPLNIAYQLHLIDAAGDEKLSEAVLKKFTSTYLLPYIINDDDKLYIPIEQHHSPEWKYYVDENLPRYKSSREFVSKLVNEKIEEFVGHFRYLFNLGNQAPIKINLINTGDSKEILQGIFKYYIKQIKQKNLDEILPIEIFIYSDKNITNAFEEVAFNENINSLKEIYKLDLSVDSMSEEDVLNLYREKVRFYSKDLATGIEYAHISFIEMNNEVKKVTSNMDDIPSGAILNGMVAGVPSVFLGDSYRTGFGTKYANIKNNRLMNIAIRLNALNAASSGEPFNPNHCKAVSIPNKNKTILDDVYNASHWVTFIDPKVDLNFFKNDPDAKDLLIIHYSDQYTTAGGYDAITVTRKSGPYQRIIEEFLEKNGIQNANEYSPTVINMFNAINGDWLLRLLSSKSHFPKEKISILSAIKVGLAKFKTNNTIWIPISLEEILRVSGGAGLKQTEGFLSAKNLGFENGVTSDDILFVGIEKQEDNVLVHYYPVEVKIGKNDSAYIHKGINQALSTKDIFNKILLPNENGDLTTQQKVYRNFLMQLVVISAEKLHLYNICESQEWIKVIDSDLRRKLLNEEYEICEATNPLLGKAAVISFKKDVSHNTDKLEDDVLIIEMSEKDGINFITQSVEEIEKQLKNSVDNDEIEMNNSGNDYERVDDSETKVIDLTMEADSSSKSVIPTNILDDTQRYNGVQSSVKEDFSSNEILNSTVESNIHSNGNQLSEENPIHHENRDMRILFGVNQKNNKEVIWYPNDTDKLFHTNTGIIGTMGTGKTQFTKSMITQIYRESKNNVDGKDVGILIFDYKGDYNKSKTDFIEATNANVYELDCLPFNPLSIVKTENSKSKLPLRAANNLKVTISKAFGLGVKQETLLRDLIMEAYEKRGIKNNDPDTWNNPAPTLKDVYDVYIAREDFKEDSLYAAFSNLIEFEIFEPDCTKTQDLFKLLHGVNVIDLSGEDPDIQNLVVAIVLDLFYSQMQTHGHSKIAGNKRQLNKIILVDEADNFLSKNFDSLKKILKEGREFGVGTILSTQLLSHFSTADNDYADYILTWIIHNVAKITPNDAKYIFNTPVKSEQEYICNQIKNLTKHHSLVKMGDRDRPITMKDRAFWELIKE